MTTLAKTARICAAIAILVGASSGAGCGDDHGSHPNGSSDANGTVHGAGSDGNTGGSGSPSGGGGGADPSVELPTEYSMQALCEADGANRMTQCPDHADDEDFRLRLCLEDASYYESIGCGAPFAAYLQCTSTDTYPSCQEGPIGCDDAAADMYFLCQSIFTQRTGCTRTPATFDAQFCDDAKPYGLRCLSDTAPAGCEAADPPDEVVPTFCCPPFDPIF